MRVEMSISRILITRIVLFSSAITLVITAFQLWTSWQEELGIIDRGLQHIQTSVLPTVSIAVWIGDDKVLDIALNSLAALPYVAQVELITTEEQGGNTLSKGSPAKHPLLHSFPMHREDWQEQIRHIGDLHITAELDQVYDKLWQQGFLFLGANFLKTLLVVGFMILLFERSVVRHLRHLAEVFQNFSLYHEFSEVRLARLQPRNDELSVLAGSFNVMGQTIRDSWLQQQRYEEKVVQLNAQLQDTNATLEQRVFERTRDLEQAHQTMVQQERLASLGTLVAGIAHEMKNPLGFVINFSKMLNRNAIDLLTELKQDLPDQEEIEALVGDISDACPQITEHGERAVSIVDTMLNHSRANDSNWAEVEIHGLLREYTKIAYHAFRANHQKINVEQIFEIDEKVPLIWGSALRLGQVFLNMLNNAFDALKEKLDQDSTFQPILTVRIAFEKGYLTIEIEDNGPGMSKSTQKQVFDAFFTTKGPGKGTGLGLSLSHSIIVEEHGGNLDVQSTEGVGTTFFIRLPQGQARKEL